MNSKKLICLLLLIAISTWWTDVALAWNDDRTHRDLSEFAAENSVLGQSKGDYLKNLGFNNGLKEDIKWNSVTQSIMRWLRDGAELEDAGTDLEGVLGKARYINHFHNPLKPWLDAGLSGAYNGESALLWAQDGGKQTFSVGGDWSWLTLRHFYYLALTSSTNADRQAYYAQTFMGLGQQVHVRNLEAHHAI